MSQREEGEGKGRNTSSASPTTARSPKNTEKDIDNGKSYLPSICFPAAAAAADGVIATLDRFDAAAAAATFEAAAAAWAAATAALFVVVWGWNPAALLNWDNAGLDI